MNKKIFDKKADLPVETPNGDDIPALETTGGGATVKRDPNKKFVTAVIAVLVVIIVAAVTAILVKEFVFTTFIVNGASMYPTLDGGSGAFNDDDKYNGEKLILDKVAKIKRNDIIVFKPDWPGTEGKDIVKRVIAVAGDKIAVTDNKVYLNGKLLNEPYINEPMYNSPDIPEFILPTNTVCCMGDNRNNSNDCRFNPPCYISLDTVIGKCVWIKGIDGKLRTP